VNIGSATQVAKSALGGAADEAGGAFRAGLAAYVAVHVLRGQSFADLDLLPEQAVPVAMKLEGDTAVDDLQVFLTGGSGFIQAKRKLHLGRSGPSSIGAVVEQWIALGQERPIDPQRDRLVAAAAEGSASVKALDSVLRRRRRRLAGVPTRAEVDALKVLESLLEGAAQREQMLDAAVVWIVDLEESEGIAARLAQALLEPGVVPPGRGKQAWDVLRLEARELARKRYGATLEDLLALLRAVPLPLTAEATGYESARVEERRERLAAYRARVQARGAAIDLRGLGASLPAMQLRDADARIEVVPSSGPGDVTGAAPERRTGMLAWAVRRRGRSLLLGLPGSGKSVALRAAAAHYAARDSWPLPIVVRLDRVARLLPALGFGEALLQVAFQQEPVEEQAALRDAAIQALRNGEAAVFLDALDETRELRAQVVAGIESELAQFDPAVELLLTTRDVAYADAHTLGLAELRLIPPNEPRETTEAILRLTAEQRHMPAQEAKHWVHERAEWIDQRLRTDRALGETPLIVVLLALLACDRSTSDLPSSRGTVLSLVIDDIVTRWETGLRLQENQVSLGSLEGQDAVQAAQLAFRVIGDVVFGEIDPTQTEVLDALTDAFRPAFGIPIARARSVAVEAVALWDEAGVFVTAGGTMRVQGRIRLFAELAAALSACAQSESGQRRWLAGALRIPEQRESILLAAGLSATIIDGLLDMASEDPSSASLLDLIIEALQQGAMPSAPSVELLLGQLTSTDSADAEDQKRRAAVVTAVPVSVSMQTRMLEFLSTLPEPLRLTSRAIATEIWPRDDEKVEEDLLALLRYETPRDTKPKRDAEHVLVLKTPDADYQRAVEVATQRLLEPGRADVADLVGSRLRRGVSFAAAGRLRRALLDAGFSAIVEREEREVIRRWKELPWPVVDGDEDIEVRLVELVRDIASAPSSLDQIRRRRLDGLASLISWTQFMEAPAFEATKSVLKEGPRLGMLLRTGALLGGLNLSDLAAEADELLAVFAEETEDPFAPLFMLADEPRDLSSYRWERIPDPADTARAVAEAVGSPYVWLGQLAVNCLAGIPRPAAETALEVLRGQLPDATLRIQFLLALAILVLDDTELARFSVDVRPAVRRAAAYRWRRIDNASLELLAALVDDADAGVSAEAVRSVRVAGLVTRLRSQLERASSNARGWECQSCGKQNTAEHLSCETCKAGRPDLEREIKAALEDDSQTPPGGQDAY